MRIAKASVLLFGVLLNHVAAFYICFLPPKKFFLLQVVTLEFLMILHFALECSLSGCECVCVLVSFRFACGSCHGCACGFLVVLVVFCVSLLVCDMLWSTGVNCVVCYCALSSISECHSVKKKLLQFFTLTLHLTCE